MYRNTVSCVRIDDMYTDWFSSASGVRQGDNLSPILFALFINNLGKEVKTTNKLIPIVDMNISILLYADDILLSENAENLQTILDTVSQWCAKWRLSINMKNQQWCIFVKKETVVTFN